MDIAYFEKKIGLTRDLKKGKTYEYGTINLRSSRLTPYAGKKVRVIIKEIEV